MSAYSDMGQMQEAREKHNSIQPGINKAVEIVEGFQIPHPTSHDAHVQNIVVGEILRELEKHL